jgi:hypothetical protein
LGISLANLNTDKKLNKEQESENKKTVSIQLQFDF